MCVSVWNGFAFSCKWKPLPHFFVHPLYFNTVFVCRNQNSARLFSVLFRKYRTKINTRIRKCMMATCWHRIKSFMINSKVWNALEIKTYRSVTLSHTFTHIFFVQKSVKLWICCFDFHFFLSFVCVFWIRLIYFWPLIMVYLVGNQRKKENLFPMCKITILLPHW